MVVRSLDTKKDHFRPQKGNEKLLGSEVPYLSAIGALMYLVNIRPNITFFVNLLARYNFSPTQRHWNGVKHTSRECVWLRSLVHYIQDNCNLLSKKEIPTILYEDNATCIAQLKGGYITGDRTKHISPKFFFTHELQRNGEIDVRQIRSCDNLTNLFTKAVSTATFKKLIYKIGMRRLRDIKRSPQQGE
ncbi:hypothetical protein M9H77_24204 [Catharanthus roseus]|uniref:Uncharacterized protein n=1 Tax=Catharanthus roseus TaxID=4058 RepID=A0ACC0AWE5_CATRO|nr:hypothetical protein M9H77_24204 [Catharanthus roseus]